MPIHKPWLILASVVAFGVAVSAQSRPQPAPTNRVDIGQSAKVVEGAAKLLASPAQWNKNDTGECPADAKTLSILCALRQAFDDTMRSATGPQASSGSAVLPSVMSECQFHATPAGQEGTCGRVFDEFPIFTIARVNAIVTGVWRKDAQPSEVWAGTMADAEDRVLSEARQLVDVVATKKYSSRLLDYNNDPVTTFADVQTFFKMLEDRVNKSDPPDLGDATDDVEIEIYPGGTGVIRTGWGWYPVTSFTLTGSTLQFRFDHEHEVPPNDLDRQILQRASAMIMSDAVWNRADTRECEPNPTTWSIYCAEEQATVEVTGAFHHRRPALELVRVIVEERSRDKAYDHRLMDYNNDPSTMLADVKSLFAEASRESDNRSVTART